MRTTFVLLITVIFLVFGSLNAFGSDAKSAKLSFLGSYDDIARIACGGVEVTESLSFATKRLPDECGDREDCVDCLEELLDDGWEFSDKTPPMFVDTSAGSECRNKPCIFYYLWYLDND